MVAARSTDAARRTAIVAAARACFLEYGYNKTSLDDIARRAGISRPLIYRKYPNKEAVFAAVFEDTYEQRYPAAIAAAEGPGGKRARLARVFEILLVEPWDLVSRAPRAIEFFAACNQMLPEVQAKYDRTCLKLTQAILGSREVAEVFMLAIAGLESDAPKTSVLRRRLQVLIERFVP